MSANRAVNAKTLGTAGVVIVLAALLVRGEMSRGQLTRLAARGNDIKAVTNIWYAYATKNNWMLPPIDAAHKRLMFVPDSVIPEYKVATGGIAAANRDGAALFVGDIDGRSQLPLRLTADPSRYAYLGYAVHSEQEGLEFLRAYRAICGRGETPGDAVIVGVGKGVLGSDRFYRLRMNLNVTLREHEIWAGAEPTIATEIPVLIELPDPSHGEGAWVAYLDSHVAYLPYPGPFPMTPGFVDALREFVPKM